MKTKEDLINEKKVGTTIVMQKIHRDTYQKGAKAQGSNKNKEISRFVEISCEHEAFTFDNLINKLIEIKINSGEVDNLLKVRINNIKEFTKDLGI